jgi:hypothetical protein
LARGGLDQYLGEGGPIQHTLRALHGFVEAVVQRTEVLVVISGPERAFPDPPRWI